MYMNTPPKRSSWKTLVTSKPDTCVVCDEAIPVGMKIRWHPSQGAVHAECTGRDFGFKSKETPLSTPSLVAAPAVPTGPVLGLPSSWAKLDDGSWGVKLRSNENGAIGHTGRTVEVTNRAGKTTTVVLGREVMHWNAGRAAVYTVVKPTKTETPAPQPAQAQLKPKVPADVMARYSKYVSWGIADTDGYFGPIALAQFASMSVEEQKRLAEEK
jgi:hypothetical protein